jgi:hypothetical protein
MKLSARISFMRIECRRCEERRIVGLPCPTCGEAPDEREVDPNRQARRRLAAASLAILHDPPPPPVTPAGDEPAIFFGRALEVMEGFLRSLIEAVADTARVEELLYAARAIRQGASDAREAPRLRPWIASWRAVDEVFRRLDSVARRYLAAISAESPREAQLEAASAQTELDAAAAPATDLAARLTRWSEVEATEGPDAALAVHAEHSFVQTGAEDLLGFDRAGAEVFRRVTGSAACPTGLGFALNIMARQAEGPFDDERFWRVAKQGFAILAADHAWLAALAGNATWIEDLDEALVRGREAAILMEATSSAVTTERLGVRVVLEGVENLVEGPGRRFAATLLAAVKGRPYGDYRGQTSGAVIESARQQPALHDLLEGLDPAIRRASAHGEFRLDGEHVVLMNRGADVEWLTQSELLDRALICAESLNAITLAVICAAAAAGVDPSVIGAGLIDEMDRGVLVAAVLGGAGWKGVEMSIEGGVTTISGRSGISKGRLMLVSALVPVLPADASVLSLNQADGEERHVLIGPLDPFRRGHPSRTRS